ncbi:MAG: thiosulfate oxidation carrier protein SoxY [SAR324 cluster bacterium]|nr:thiosulfate oxidation carrier protein SoxY [SAR324 cluster bacterium]
MHRRDFFRRVLENAVLVPALLSWPLSASPLLAAWSQSAFREQDFAKSTRAVFGDTPIEESPEVQLELPKQRENGSVVPLEISSTLQGVELFALFIEQNPTPLAGIYKFRKRTLPFISTRIKVVEGDAVHVVVVAKAGSRLYKTSGRVKIIIGGCD